MLCESCQQHEATIHVTQVIGGDSRELHLCEECAEETGLNVQTVMSLPEILFGMSGTEEAGKALDRRCPRCHMRGSDFKKTGRLGCPHCYEAFSQELSPMLAAMHKGLVHTGKVPARERKVMETASRMEGLRKRLDQAVGSENFEEAARLRDLIREAEHDAG
ncbi:MAG: UvrB/UvrC motif-containing protein [bacterium]|jgi:protein arginine kinase activator